ncbi:methyltransferase domain-containing protein [Candidatus Roizmanbacteria bacterium]|nr:methyltransferase domain-containing protein [Candidatus Roizmanbacteria bacterium]
MKKLHTESLQKVVSYFNSIESRVGYSLLLKGTKHFGYYPPGKDTLSFAEAQVLMEQQLARKLGLPNNSLVLDAGCGEGNVALHLVKQFGYRIQGVDLLAFAVNKAKIKAENQGLDDKANFHVGDYTFLHFPDSTFDAIYTMETLVHVPNYRKALKEFYRVLKPQGKLILFEYSVSSRETLTQKQQKMVDLIMNGSGMHSLPYFLHDTFGLMLKRAGFTQITVTNITPRILPMLRKLYLFALLPYQLIKFLGYQHKFINAVTAVEGYKLVQSGDYWRYNIVSAVKA